MSADSFIPLAIAGAFFFAAPSLLPVSPLPVLQLPFRSLHRLQLTPAARPPLNRPAASANSRPVSPAKAPKTSRPSARFKAAIRLCRAVSVPLPTRSAKTSRRPRRRPPVNYTLPARPPPKMPPACSVLLRQKPRRFPINGAPRMTPCWPSTVPTCTHRFRRPARSWKPARQT